MKIGYAYCSNDALSENRAALTEVGCDCVLHDNLGQGRKALLSIRQLMRAEDTLIIRSVRQAADSIHELDGLAQDVLKAKAELVILAENHTTRTVVQALGLLRSLSSTGLQPDGVGGIGHGPEAAASPMSPRNGGGRKRVRPISDEEVMRRLGSGETVNAIAKDVGVAWATIDSIRKRHQST
ncbi:hypothetical protein [Roseomonas genomospecies 6]|uniref:Recombinase family protein n=1 Tax=Roseomonas genomospecies 6 TaxID=214106 RepID=A0A9W7KN71_9PROT|nr:hypothetical protein [Roseomonas genomospecies 6]KAA0675885.1 hypothetical protein DS843_29575 [Roseomonas genomospecies 6]